MAPPTFWYKILDEAPPSPLPSTLPATSLDAQDGFIHLSTGPQVAATLARHFAGEQGLWLLAVPTGGLDALRWEPSRAGALFPHLYRALRAADVLWARPIPPEGAPEDLA